MNQQRLINFLVEICKIYSPSGSEQNITEFLEKVFKEFGETQITDVGNLIVLIPGEGESILWCAHTDVVSPCKNVSPVCENGVIKNSGDHVLGIDNKAAIACFYEAIQILKEEKTLHRPIELVFTVQEETNFTGSLSLDYDSLQSNRGITIDSATPIGTIIFESPCLYNFRWYVSGPTGHTKLLNQSHTYAWQGLQAIVNKCPFGQLANRTNVNWAIVQGGSGTNTITPEFVIKGEMRSFDKIVADQLIADFRILEQDLQKQFPKNAIKLDIENVASGYQIAKDDLWLKKIQDVMAKIAKPEMITSYGLADGNILRGKGINMVNIGSGSFDSHTKDERIGVKDLTDIVEFLVLLNQ